MPAGHIVVFRPGALGDTLLSIDALAALRRRFPGAELELVGNREAGGLLARGGLVDFVSSFDAPEVTALYLSPPTITDRWRHAALVVLWLRDGAPIAEAFRAAGAALVVCAAPAPAGPDQHVSDHLVCTLAPAGVADPGGGSGEALTLSGPASGSSASAARRAILHPGSGSASKNWPPAHYAALARMLAQGGWRIWLLRGPADHAAIADVQNAVCFCGSSPLPIAEPCDLTELARVLATGELFVGNDSGVSHLSARLGVPTVAVFGPTSPRRWAPRGPRVSVVDGAGAWPGVDAVHSAIRALLAERAEPASPAAKHPETGHDGQRLGRQGAPNQVHGQGAPDGADWRLARAAGPSFEEKRARE